MSGVWVCVTPLIKGGDVVTVCRCFFFKWNVGKEEKLVATKKSHENIYRRYI